MLPEPGQQIRLGGFGVAELLPQVDQVSEDFCQLTIGNRLETRLARIQFTQIFTPKI